MQDINLRNSYVVIIAYEYGWSNGGAGSVAIQNALEAKMLGYNTIFYCMTGPIDKRLTENGIEVICLNQHTLIDDPNRVRASINGIWNFKAYKVLIHLLKKLEANKIIFHVHGFSHGLSASIIKACRNKAKVVLHLHEYSSICPNGGLFNFKSNSFCLVNPMSTKCICTNCDSRSYFHKLYRVMKQLPLKKWIINNKNLIFVYISEFSKNKLESYLLSKDYHYIHNPIGNLNYICEDFHEKSTYLFLGRMSPEKGISLFCEAVKATKKKAIVIGGCDNLEDFRQNYPMIDFVGWVDNMEINKYLHDVKCLIMSSLCFETDGIAVQELLKAHIPCIVPIESASSDYIKNGKNGILYKSGDIQDLKRAILDIDGVTGMFEESTYTFSDDLDKFYNSILGSN